MTLLADALLLRPWWLLALPLILLALRRQGRSGRLAGWSVAIDAALLGAIERFGGVLPGKSPGRWLPAAIAALCVLALAGPAVRSGETASFRNLDGVVVVVDVSRSVTLGGALPTARSAARLVAENAAGRPVALVVYAGDAYLASPFTTDAPALGTMIEALDGDTVPDRGSCLGCALARTRGMIGDARTVSSDVVLVSDGGGTLEAEAELVALVEAGARISTLYVEPQARVSDMPAPDPEALAEAAARGGGVAGLAAEPAGLIAAVAARPGSGSLAGDARFLAVTDFGRGLLVIPALMTLGFFRRRA